MKTNQGFFHVSILSLLIVFFTAYVSIFIICDPQYEKLSDFSNHKICQEFILPGWAQASNYWHTTCEQIILQTVPNTLKKARVTAKQFKTNVSKLNSRARQALKRNIRDSQPDSEANIARPAENLPFPAVAETTKIIRPVTENLSPESLTEPIIELFSEPVSSTTTSTAASALQDATLDSVSPQETSESSLNATKSVNDVDSEPATQNNTSFVGISIDTAGPSSIVIEIVNSTVYYDAPAVDFELLKTAIESSFYAPQTITETSIISSLATGTIQADTFLNSESTKLSLPDSAIPTSADKETFKVVQISSTPIVDAQSTIKVEETSAAVKPLSSSSILKIKTKVKTDKDSAKVATTQSTSIVTSKTETSIRASPSAVKSSTLTVNSKTAKLNQTISAIPSVQPTSTTTKSKTKTIKETTIITSKTSTSISTKKSTNPEKTKTKSKSIVIGSTMSPQSTITESLTESKTGESTAAILTAIEPALAETSSVPANSSNADFIISGDQISYSSDGTTLNSSKSISFTSELSTVTSTSTFVTSTVSTIEPTLITTQSILTIVNKTPTNTVTSTLLATVIETIEEDEKGEYSEDSDGSDASNADFDTSEGPIPSESVQID